MKISVASTPPGWVDNTLLVKAAAAKQNPVPSSFVLPFSENQAHKHRQDKARSSAALPTSAFIRLSPRKGMPNPSFVLNLLFILFS
jgi:hypothetical protein